MTARLAWSDAVGKRVRTGDLAEQAIPTLRAAADALAEAGDAFGLLAGRREAAAQLVDSFMEEAKVVHVIYRVWTEGFLGWLGTNGVTAAELAAKGQTTKRVWTAMSAARTAAAHVIVSKFIPCRSVTPP